MKYAGSPKLTKTPSNFGIMRKTMHGYHQTSTKSVTTFIVCNNEWRKTSLEGYKLCENVARYTCLERLTGQPFHKHNKKYTKPCYWFNNNILLILDSSCLRLTVHISPMVLNKNTLYDTTIGSYQEKLKKPRELFAFFLDIRVLIKGFTQVEVTYWQLDWGLLPKKYVKAS